MVERHFGFQRTPFPAAVDPDSYYPAGGHQRAAARLGEAVAAGEAFAVLSGEPGVGKTLVAHRVIDALRADRPILWIGNTHLPDQTALFQSLLFDLEQPYAGKAEHELRLQFTDWLLARFQEGKPALLVIDEAQHLKPAQLEELRLLSNLESDGKRAIQVLLIGQPALRDRLERPECRAICQRIALRFELASLDEQEAANYVRHHLRCAMLNRSGTRSDDPARLIESEALETLVQATGGVPGTINQAMRRALQLAAEARQPSVDVEAVIEAVSEMGLGDGEWSAGGPRVSPLQAAG